MAFRFLYLDQLILPGADADLLAVLQTAAPVGVRVQALKVVMHMGLGVRTIYNPVPIYMGDKPGALTVDYGVAYFTLESRDEAAKILDMIRVHAPFEEDFTRGLYFKGTN